MTYKEWPATCQCGWSGRRLAWDTELPYKCPACTDPVMITDTRSNQSHGIVPDDFPGGLEVRHGLVNEDGSPMRFYSRTELKREANRRGLVLEGDSPKPYRV